MPTRSALRDQRRMAVRLRRVLPTAVPREMCEDAIVIAQETRTEFDRFFADFRIDMPLPPPLPYDHATNRNGRKEMDWVINETDGFVEDKAEDCRYYEANNPSDPRRIAWIERRWEHQREAIRKELAKV